MSLAAIAASAVHILKRRADPHAELQHRLRNGFKAGEVALYGSGTQALTEAIRIALSVRPGPVALPAFGCYDLASAAMGAGAEVLLYDIDPVTLNPDWQSLEAALRNGAGSVVIAYLFGYPIDWQRALLLAQEHGAELIEDAAQGMGGSWNGTPLGALGPLSVLSFGRGKGWTGGHGGALLVRDRSFAPRTGGPVHTSDELRNIAGTAAQWLLARPSIYAVPAAIPFLALGETRFKPPVPLTAMERTAARIVLHVQQISFEENEHRRRSASLLDGLIDPSCVQRMHVVPGGMPGYLRYPVLLPEGRSLQDMARARSLGIARSYPMPLSHLPALKPHLGRQDLPLPGAASLADRLITLPVHSAVPPAELNALAALVNAG